MKNKTETLKSFAKQLKLSSLGETMDDILMRAQEEQSSYSDFALKIFKTEIDYRNNQKLYKRLKTAKIPHENNLEKWKHDRQNGITKQQLNQLRECIWLEQCFNILLMGPSGTGKTYIASGLCNDAIQKGYKAIFRTMEQLIYILKMKDITRTAAIEFKTITKANLVVIDDIMMFPIEKKQAIALFNLINHLHQNASIIVTTNKSPDEWAAMLDDEVLATAILDRLLYNCEIIKLKGKSYRLENRKSIFEKTTQ